MRSIKTFILILLISTASCKTKIPVTNEDLVGDYHYYESGYHYRLLLDKTEFKYWKNYGHSADFTMGEWLNKNDQIQLNSKKLSSEESLSMSLSSANGLHLRIEFLGSEMQS